MPSSTLWRRRTSGFSTRGASPTRPSENSIERLSPEPFEPPAAIKYSGSAGRSYSDGRRPQGLGLSGTTLTHDTSHFVQPDHLYIDQNGGAHVGARVRHPSFHSSNSVKAARNSEITQTTKQYKTSRNKTHTRSGSTIDDLANAAIATSPTFTNGSSIYAFGSPTNSNIRRPITSYVNANGYGHDENSYDRPSKRVKSDKPQSLDWSPQTERPRTSHAYEYQSPRREEAELLLNLSYGISGFPRASIAAPPAPISETEYYVATRKDTAAIMPESDAIMLDTSPILESSEADHNATGGGLAKVEIEEPRQEVVKTEELPLPEVTTQPPRLEEMGVTERSQSINPAPEPELDPSPAEQLQEGSLTMPVEIEVTATATPKKPRKIQPEVQAEVCALCKKLQREGNDEETTTQWIECGHCQKWYHVACAGFKDKQEARSVDKFSCGECEPLHGKTSYLRKSTRARTAIDYAGLNQGVVKPSDDSTMHHYIQPIKDGKIKVLPDDFARIRPELLTAEFWENMDGMKRPFVVPACWNPRFGVKHTGNAEEFDLLETKPQPDKDQVCYDGRGQVLAGPPNGQSHVTTNGEASSIQEEVIDCDQDYLDMVMPRDLTVRKVAELFGPHEPVPVIDVKSQETKGAFTLGDWAEYYELDGEKPIRNVISLEVSNSRLGRLIRRPRVVRDVDLEDNVWDQELRSTSNKRPVQFYCLMSVADSYTDFHIDFGGSSVYYHILEGVKTFFFIPPEDKYLKKYEEWCNSDTQNETWLGSLCNDNVTRVDLHQGDTAFIPAGWIHSVWTPKDSLVIGGNFLTRLDYELQLKVANIERTTRVPLKFRYPFFQKVMWFTLLKYLEDDPLPEEVLRDFHDDSDHRFLRANPIWHETGDLANTAEPGEIEFNARTYAKSELRGLPSLRDYLYRTARINADLPVPDINKKQIDAVKSSIPRGCGDPMQLIKTFAVWCAWKIGNEPAPEWVHSDLGLTVELKEREKAKKPEVFRAPPERVSARKASQVPSTRVTPPAEELVNTPSSLVQDMEVEEPVKKPKTASKVSTLKVACEPCRKRRIKCRHKNGDVQITESPSATIKPRTHSNVSVDVSNLAPTSPPPTASEPTPTVNGDLSDSNITSDLAQTALASLSSQPSDPTQLTPTSMNGFSSKKGRSKACEECRKSKRRCVHDEHGRVDPAKAAEPSKPRGSATKRVSRPSDEGIIRNFKTESELDSSLIDPLLADLTHPIDTNANIDPALMAETYQGADQTFDEYLVDSVLDGLELQVTAGRDTTQSMVDTKLVNSEQMQPQYISAVGDDELIDPNLEVGDLSRDRLPTPLVTAQVAYLRQSPELDISYSPITVDGQAVESTEKSDIDMMETPLEVMSSRHSSRHSKPVERYVPEDHRPRSKSSSSSSGRERRGSSYSTSDPTTALAAGTYQSPVINPSTAFRHSTAEAKRRQSVDLPGRRMSRGSTTESDMTADEKLARELQASENGLRRRTSVRA